ncbi:MAG: leucine-rich repeat domain-containing protein, partial [Alphaproteobacteria bacterium]|nr:leucine-rich repeat domain-containing protein [Alphaproteobacteria bacterium]
MRKLLLGICAAAAFWANDAEGMKGVFTEAEYEMEIKKPRKVCQACELGTSAKDIALLKNCAEFPNLEQIEIEDEDAWIFRRPKFEDPDSFLFSVRYIISEKIPNGPDPTITRFIFREEGEPILEKRIKSFPKLKRIIGRQTRRNIDHSSYNPYDYSLYDPFGEYGEPYADCSMKRILQDITKLQTLEEISLNGWNLACVRLPREIENLQNLRVLSITNCGLHQLPESIGNLQNLRVLSITNCGLHQLPESIGNLRNLQHLELRNEHHLKSLPESIGNLKNLQSLNLRGTHIKSFPKSIKNLGKLKTLDLRNSPIESYPFYFYALGINHTLKNLPDFIWEMPA